MRKVPGWIVAVFLLAGCGRAFDEPPPVPVIETFENLDEFRNRDGFEGDWIEIQGANFGAAVEDNSVSFGSQGARVREASGTRLVVEVPAGLAPGESVHLRVTTAAGQGTSDDPFVCLGPGHPPDEKPDQSILVEWAPLATSPILLPDDGSVAPIVPVANYGGRSVSLLRVDDGTHYDFGVGNAPVSVALVRTALFTRIFVTTLAMEAMSDTIVDTQLMVLSLPNDSEELFPQIETAFVEDRPAMNEISFQPLHLWAYCRQMGPSRCLDPGVAVTDLFRPALMLVDPGTNGLLDFIELESFPCVTLQDTKAISGLTFDRQQDLFFATVEKSDVIWSISLDKMHCPWPIWSAGNFSAPGVLAGVALRRIPGPSPEQDGVFLYTIETRSETLLELEITSDPTEGIPMQQTVEQRRAAPLHAAAFSLTTARSGDHGYLHVATEDGILIFDLDPEEVIDNNVLPLVGRVSLPGSHGGPKSLSLAHYLPQGPVPPEGGRPDDIIWTDTARDQVLVIPAGSDGSRLSAFPLALFVPQVATSRFSDAIYLGDPQSNVIRLIDRHSGLQADQFPVLDAKAFGILDLAVLDALAADLMLLPLPDSDRLQSDTAGRMDFDRIVVRRAGGLEDIGEWIDEDFKNGQDRDLFHMNMDEEPFHEMLPAVNSGALYLVRYGDNEGDGRFWTYQMAPGATDLDGILISKGSRDDGPVYGFVDFPLPASVQMVRLCLEENGVVILNSPADAPPAVLVARIDELPELRELGLSGLMTQLISDVAARSVRPGDPVYLALPSLGQVMVIEGDVRRFIETTGMPTRLHLSPDGKRLYVTHPDIGWLSIIDTDCREAPACERVVANLRIESRPYEVVFHPSGKVGFVTHFLSNAITVIE